MNTFKNGDWIPRSEVKNDEQLKAMHAVCGLMFKEGLIWVANEMAFFSEQEVLQNMYDESNPDQQHTLSEWLFKDAPCWAVDLRIYNLNYVWTNGKDTFRFIDQSGNQSFTGRCKGKIIATTKALEAKAVRNALRSEAIKKAPNWQDQKTRKSLHSLEYSAKNAMGKFMVVHVDFIKDLIKLYRSGNKDGNNENPG